MDLWSVQAKHTTTSALLLRNSFPEKPISWNPTKSRISLLGIDDGRVFKIRVRSSGFRSFVVRANGKKNQGNSSSSGMLSSLFLNHHLHAVSFSGFINFSTGS